MGRKSASLVSGDVANMLGSRPGKGLLTWVPIQLGSIIFIKFSLVFSINTRCHYLLEPVALIPLFRNECLYNLIIDKNDDTVMKTELYPIILSK